MSREATSEQLSVREGAGYDEVFNSGHELDDGFSYSSKRETSAQSPDEDVESCNGGEGKEEVVGEGEDENDEGKEEREDTGDEDNGDKETSDGVSGSLGDGHTHPFILPKIWTVNDFMPTMSIEVFNTL